VHIPDSSSDSSVEIFSVEIFSIEAMPMPARKLMLLVAVRKE
jgi:hypothetical protein